MNAAVIADIVGSRRLEDRAAAQRDLDDTIARVESDFPLAVRALRPIVGDELQGVYPSLVAASASLLLLRLALPDGIECRFGIGVGPLADVPSITVGTISEGPAWWAARAAIEIVHRKQSRSLSNARTWAVAAAGEGAGDGAAVRLANSSFLTRDQLVGGMSERTRRITYSRCLGATQREIAAAEQITQSAVSQALAASGGAVLADGLSTLLAAE
ncbi:SatD family protein [Microbacterium sp. zg-YB36]|uniref:SatD family protein n=1 Tax=Microbacterium sp. zg-YB36 TaxID=2969407 RepID=UPI00214A9BC2|nr:SatD family protein [Microbacterium sp. zg-YB36]MDL5352891.1 SatD family protein [Microbacterium sp. zg-YB36]